MDLTIYENAASSCGFYLAGHFPLRENKKVGQRSISTAAPKVCNLKDNVQRTLFKPYWHCLNACLSHSCSFILLSSFLFMRAGLTFKIDAINPNCMKNSTAFKFAKKIFSTRNIIKIPDNEQKSP